MLKRVFFSFKVLNNIIRVAKKPVVIAATKCDEANEVLVRELERLVNRKDLKQLNIPVVETSSHEGNILDCFQQGQHNHLFLEQVSTSMLHFSPLLS